MAEIVVRLVNGELAGKTAQSIAKEINAAAVAAKKAEVGTKDWIDAHARLDKAKALQEDLRKQVNATKTSSDALKAAWNQLPGAQFFNQISDSFSLMKQGVGGLTSQFGVLKVAIASTGIGLIVLAVGALIVAFQKFTPIVDKVEQVLSGISAVVNELIQRIQNFGVAVWDIITGATSLSEGIDKAAGSFDGMGKSMQDAYNAGVELKQLQQDLEDAARGMEIANIKAEKSVERMIIASKNRALTEAQQIEILKEARRVAEENQKAQDDFHQREYEALIKEAQLSSKLTEDEIIQLTEGTLAQEIEYARRGQLSDDLLIKIKDNLIKRIQEEGETGKLLEKIQNAENQRLEKLDADRQKAADKEKQRQADLAKERDRIRKEQEAADKNIEDLRIKAMEEGMDKEIEQLHLDTERKIEALVGTETQIAEQKALLKDIELQQIAAIEQKYRDQATAAQAAKDAKDLADAQKKADEEKRIAQDKADFERDLAELNMEIAEGAISFGAELTARTAKNEKDAKRIRKTGAVVEIGINLQKELSAIALKAADIAATIPGPAGVIAAASYATAAKLKALLFAGINTAKVIAFEKGGLLRGPKHVNGGIPGVIRSTRQPIEMEGDEFVFSGKAVRAIGADKLTAINDYYTRRLATGGPVNPFPASDPARTLTPAVASNQELMAVFQREFGAFRQEISTWQRTLVVKNVLTDTEEGLRTLNTIRNDADV